MTISRRTFLKGVGAAGLVTLAPAVRSEAKIGQDSYATLIDLNKCDGCEGKETPLCVSACRTEKKDLFPKVDKDQLLNYWPQKKYEDWSDKQHLIDRFTPYNWLFVQQVEVDGKKISIPRRCMHCDNPPCAKLCPFGVKHKTAEGPVYIDHSLCFGGAKCRAVCPWTVPQRQAGVGIYTLWQKFLPVAGGGVMYKCDLCRDLLAEGKTPYCMVSCPQKAMTIGRREDIFAKATQLKEDQRGYLYGMDENGGTSTIYFSPVAFDKIDKALSAGHNPKNKSKPVPLHKAENILEKQNLWTQLSLAAPIIGVVAALGLTRGETTETEDK
ncbi:MAG: hypothetical protein BA866_01545 [Desulfobulbaceae bacterium S5133MH15]|nr:MAG: hypothetical protein BA866_01545 [Desulfobulbaceae bacterium S5133MH15]OEU81727.1 MAG: hypothetical protein BA873_12525 [Desulfobulbaceae bacterium C00003063]